ncbi:uncharacterized protein LOC128725563 [Anopheles nili]|uniref:uncharacterized protein LOC128725563 n=1 Tax=Anopheles nili TaxID=185578 RepID=UPI00237A609C|nr:uncharacterized protein LOC128725563 [Anopheles nili]
MKFLVCLVVVAASCVLSRGEFVECDLDLNDSAILSKLPEECQGLNDTIKALMLEEAASFKEFHQKLLSYEAANDEEFIHTDMDFRNQLYLEADLYTCRSIKDSIDQFLQCLIEKRRKMVDIIDSHSS